MNMARKQDKNNWTHLFEVDSPSDHRKGFTVYRITSKVYLRNLPESVTKIVVWKRFNDIKKLYKELKTIHGDLYLKGEFPDFPKPNVFKRFDFDVIEERRRSALNLLVFASGHSQLYTSSAFLKFFQDGYDSNDVFYHGKNDDTESSDKNLPFQECLVPEKLWTSSQECDGDEDDESRTTDTESLNSSDILTNTLESPSRTATSSKMTKSRSALEPIGSNFTVLASNSSDEEEVEEYSRRPNVSSKSKSVISSNSCSSLSSVPESTSTLTCKLNNERVSNDQQSSSSLSSTKHLIQESINNLLDFLPIFPKRVETTNRVATNDQILSESLNESYLCEAAGHFTLAQQHESNNEYLNAFQSYKEGIRILLNGVQRDSNTSRKLLVRKKLEKYLSKAEQIHDIIQNSKKDSIHSSNSNKFQSFLFNKFKLLNDDKLETESTNNISEQIQMVPSNLEELRDYKVIGLSSNSLFIVMDTKYVTGPKSYALKVLQKTNKLTNCLEKLNNIIPQNVPFMVTLKKWYNLENSIILLLQYACGGNLRDFVHSYQRKDIPFVVYKNEVEGEDTSIDESSQVKINMKNEKDCKLVENEMKMKMSEMTLDESDIPHLMEPDRESIESVEKKSNENDIFDVGTATLFKDTDDDLIISETIGSTTSITLQSQSTTNSPLSSPLKDSKPFDGPSWSDLDAFDTELLIDSSKKLLEGISTTLAELDQKQRQSEEEVEGDKISNTSVLKESLLPEKAGNEPSTVKSKNLTVSSPTYSSKGMFKSKSDQNLIRYNNKNIMDDGSTSKEEKEPIPKSFYSPKKTLLIYDEIPVKRMIPECSVKVWASEIILSLQKLHSFGLAFGDLEMKNIMLGESGHILLTYKSFWAEVEQQVLARGSINSAPEIRYSFGTSLSKIRPFSDWWSFGAILFELLIGQSVDSVFIEGFHPQTIIRIPDQNICGQKISERAKSLLIELLQHNPRSRLGFYGAEEVKAHPFFEEIDWNSLN